MALTKVAGDILDPGISIAGVVTATAFDGPFRGGSSSDIIAGVGTFTELDVNGNVDISGNLTVQGDTTTLNTTLRNVELLRVAANSNTTAGIITQTGTGDLLRLDDGSTRAVTVFSGIGTVSQADEGGQVSIGSTFMWRTDTVAQVYGKSPDLSLSRFNDQFMVAGSETNGAANTGAGIQLFGHDGVSERGMAYIRGLKENGTSGDRASYLAFATRINGGTLEERVRITSDGKIGIGVTNPVQKLSVFGNIYQRQGDIITWNNGDCQIGGVSGYHFVTSTYDGSSSMVERVRVTGGSDGGKVGIGITNPGAELHAYHATSNTIAQFESGDAGAGAIWKDNSTYSSIEQNGTDFIISADQGASHANSALSFKVDTSEKLRITSDGDVRQVWNDGNFLGSYYDSTYYMGFTFGATARTLYIDNRANDTRADIVFRTKEGGAPEERLRINKDGKVFVGAGCTDASLFNVKGQAGFADDGTNAGLIISTDDTNGAALSCLTTGGFVNGAYGNIRFNALSHKFTYGNTQRLLIDSTGLATFAGEIATAQDYPNYRPRVDWNFAAVKQLDPRITYRRTGPASYTDEFGIVKVVSDNTPRFDHDPVTGESKGLLIEEARTNLAANSEDMTASTWSSNTSTRSKDTSVITPDGTTGATKIFETATTSSHFTYDNVTASASTGYITSVFLKKPATNGRTFGLITEGNTQPCTTYFNLVDGTSTGSGTGYVSSGTIEYPNGWWRCWMRFNTGGSQSTLNVQFGPAGDSGTGTFSYAGDTSKYILAWGAQCESGEMITSYIPTYGSTVTRGLDLTTVDGTDFSDIFDTDFKQFSMVADYDNTTTPDGNSYGIIDLWGESTGYDDRVEWFKDNASPYHIETRSFGQGNATFSNGNLSASSKAKAQRFATSWYVPDYSNTTSRRSVVSMGGEAVDIIADNSGTTVPQLTRMGIGCNPTRLDFSGGVLHFKRLMLYNRTLSDGQLQNLSAQ